MKILELASYAYFKGHKGFEKNNSGFAYAVSDICESLTAYGDEVYIITQSGITDGFSHNKTIVVKKKWADILRNLNMRDIYYGLCANRGAAIDFSGKLKVIYYYLNRGYVEKMIRTINPDVIHVQSISDYTIPFMLAASHAGKPFIVSSHGLATFLEDVDPKLKRLEGEFFRIAEKNGTVVTAVSSGIKKRIIHHYKLNGSNIEIIPNGYMPGDTEIDTDKLTCLREKYGIASDTFVFICVGSISYRKNQLQVARAFRLLMGQEKNIKLFFAGFGPQFDELKDYVFENQLENSIIMLGNVNHNEMSYYYLISNCTILASVDEGFGLPVIEGYFFGIPSVLYGDLDASEDISFPDTTVVVKQRGDRNFANGMAEVMKTKWDENKIKDRAKLFTNEKMGENYHMALERGIESNSTIPYRKIVDFITERI